MATLIVADILDALVDAIDAARIAAAHDTRWLNAINAGADWLLQQDSIEFDAERHELTVNSPSGKTYHANGACQCEAFAQHNACWHRAAARLVRRALELQALESAQAPTSAVDRLHEVQSLADALYLDATSGDWLDARHEAGRELDGLLAYAAEYDRSSAAARIARAAAVAAELFA